MGNTIQIEGNKFGRLLAIKEVGKYRDGSALWECICDCGATLIVKGYRLRNGHTKSCGCLKKEVVTKHGHNINNVKSSEYHSWDAMKQRCLNPNHARFCDYGGRGIKICDRWLIFKNFLQDMGPKPTSKHTIERVINGGNYEPSNCIWATMMEQSKNRRVRKDSKKRVNEIIG